MRFKLLPWLLLFCHFGLAQTISSVESSASSSGVVTVTSISTLAIIVIPPSNTSSAESSPLAIQTTLTKNTKTTSSALQLPTFPYTGQAILVGNCNVPQYTTLALHNGAVIEAPLVGCSDDRPECCPSLSPPESMSTEMSPFPSSTASTSVESPTPTGVVSMLSASPLSICPHDFIDIDPVCCPRGYSLYGQAIVGGITPCYSMLSTSVPLPISVSNSIVSAVAMTASSAATVSVIINEVYALGLPCADEPSSKGGLSTGAKVGIGIGAGLGGLLLLGMVFFTGICLQRRKSRRESERASQAQPQEKQWTPHLGTIAPIGNVGASYHPQMSPQFQPSTIPGSFPANHMYHTNMPHASWMSQTSGVLPQYQPPTVEMQSTESHAIHEIGGPGTEAYSVSVDKSSSAQR